MKTIAVLHTFCYRASQCQIPRAMSKTWCVVGRFFILYVLIQGYCQPDNHNQATKGGRSFGRLRISYCISCKITILILKLTHILTSTFWHTSNEIISNQQAMRVFCLLYVQKGGAICYNIFMILFEFRCTFAQETNGSEIFF